MTSKKLTTLWTQGLKHNSKEKQDFEEYVRNCTALLTRLDDIIQEELRAVLEDESTEAQYDEGWGYLQAHRNGKKDILRKFQKLTDHL